MNEVPQPMEAAPPHHYPYVTACGDPPMPTQFPIPGLSSIARWRACFSHDRPVGVSSKGTGHLTPLAGIRSERMLNTAGRRGGRTTSSEVAQREDSAMSIYLAIFPVPENIFPIPSSHHPPNSLSITGSGKMDPYLPSPVTPARLCLSF
jgi:hypothetical protein